MRLAAVMLAALALAGCGGGSSPSTDGALDAALAAVGERDAAERAEAIEPTDGGAVVTIDFEGMRDDSVRAERDVVELARDGDGWRVVSKRTTYACQRGRGHEDFSSELCL